MFTAILSLIAAVIAIAFIFNRLSIHRVNARQAYYAGIRSAEKKQFERVYGRYIHARA